MATPRAGGTDLPDAVFWELRPTPAGSDKLVELSPILDSLAPAELHPATTEAALDGYAEARLVGLRAALAILAFLALVALFLAQRIPTRQPGAPDASTRA